MMVPAEVGDLGEELGGGALAHQRLHVLPHRPGPVHDSVQGKDDGTSGVNPPLKAVSQQGCSQACREKRRGINMRR
jgi:hypothetical protein